MRSLHHYNILYCVDTATSDGRISKVKLEESLAEN